MKTISVIILTLILVSCADSPAWRSMRISSTEFKARINNEKNMNSNIGQSKQEVLEIMGKPAKRQIYQLGNQRVIEFLFYCTSGWSGTDWSNKDYQFTPLAFENNELVGWGQNYYDNLIRAAIEIKTK